MSRHLILSTLELFYFNIKMPYSFEQGIRKYIYVKDLCKTNIIYSGFSISNFP